MQIRLAPLHTGESPAARRAAAATLHNLSTADAELVSSNNRNVFEHDINSRNNGDGLDAAALALTRLQDAVDAIIAVHASASDVAAAAPQPWALNATHPLLCRLLHEIHVIARGGDPEGPGCGTHLETEPGLLHLTRLLAAADVRSGRNVLGVSDADARNPLVAAADDDFDVIGAWLDDDGGLDVDTLRGGIGSRTVSASEAARAGLLALPLNAHVSMMRCQNDGRAVHVDPRLSPE